MAKPEKSLFDIKQQPTDVAGKIVVGLERISEAFRVLLWEKANEFGLTPIQIQVLIFLKFHADKYCGVSYLAKEFNMTKPTISDAVKSLEGKGYIVRKASTSDARSHVIALTVNGKKVTASTEHFASPIKEKIRQLDPEDQLNLLDQVIKIVSGLNHAGVVSVQRTCYACTHYSRDKGEPYCQLLKQVLHTTNIRLDCPEFEMAE